MISNVARAEAESFGALVGRKSRGARLRSLALRHPLGLLSFVILILLTVLAVFAPIVSQGVDPLKVNGMNVLLPPGPSHLAGTDEFGRDIFTRIVYGARISLWVGLIAVGISVVIGVPMGLISGYAGGKVDMVLQRIVDALFAFPTIILAMTVISVLGRGILPVTIAVGIVGVPRMARVVRASTLNVMAQPYLEASLAIGAAAPRVLFRHIAPNIMAPVIVLATAGVGVAILAEASLSFLGLGVTPPQPSWGTMLSGGAQQYIRIAPWMAIAPGIAISVSVFAFNLFGDSLRDILDPRLRGV